MDVFNDQHCNPFLFLQSTKKVGKQGSPVGAVFARATDVAFNLFGNIIKGSLRTGSKQRITGSLEDVAILALRFAEFIC